MLPQGWYVWDPGAPTDLGEWWRWRWRKQDGTVRGGAQPALSTVPGRGIRCLAPNPPSSSWLLHSPRPELSLKYRLSLYTLGALVQGSPDFSLRFRALRRLALLISSFSHVGCGPYANRQLTLCRAAGLRLCGEALKDAKSREHAYFLNSPPIWFVTVGRSCSPTWLQSARGWDRGTVVHWALFQDVLTIILVFYFFPLTCLKLCMVLPNLLN